MIENSQNRRITIRLGIIGITFLLLIGSCEIAKEIAEEITGQVPGMPGVITHGVITTNTVVLNWSAPRDPGKNPGGGTASVTGYQLEYSNTDGAWIALNRFGNGIHLSNAIETNTTATVLGLTAATDYGFRVAASNAVGIGSLTAVYTIKTSSSAREPGAVGVISRGAATTNSLVLNWSEPSYPGLTPNGGTGSIIGYVLEYSNAQQNWTALTTGTGGIRLNHAMGADTTATVLGLSNLTTYGFRVSAMNGNGASSTGKPSPPLIIDYILVTNISLSSASFNLNRQGVAVVTVSFQPVGAVNTNVTWANSNPAATTVTETVSDKGDSVTITGTAIGVTTITIMVGGRSAQVMVNVLPNSPENFRQVLSCTKATEVELAWDPSPDGNEYRIYEVAGTDRGLKVTTNVTSYTSMGLVANNYYTYEIEACAGGLCSTPTSLKAVTGNTGKNLSGIITNGQIPSDLNNYPFSSLAAFEAYPANSPLSFRYVLPGGAGSKDGTSWLNASDNVKTVIDNIQDAAADKVYAVLIAPGVYQAGDSISMKNYVTITGGVSGCNTIPENYEESTILSGEDRYRVFNNNGLTNYSRLHGVIIANGKADKGGGMYNNNASPTLVEVIFSSNTADKGGGMYNVNSSPYLSGLKFNYNTADIGGGMYNDNASPLFYDLTMNGNKAYSGGGMFNDNASPTLEFVYILGSRANYGGGMYNYNASPVINGAYFYGNYAEDEGGGMYNDSSSPKLTQVIFFKESANRGGGMYNEDSPPVLTKVIFIENQSYYGGGMYNSSSPAVLTQVSFVENLAGYYGGGMYNEQSSPVLTSYIFNSNRSYYGGGMYNEENSDSVLVGGVFWGNSSETNQGGIYYKDSSITLVNSILWENRDNGIPTNTYSTIVQGGMVDPAKNIITNNPGLDEITNHGPGIAAMAIHPGSPAVDQGLYVKRSETASGTDSGGRNAYLIYYSDDSTTWYDNPSLTGTSVTPPADAIDVTAQDITGYSVTGRPDIGGYEARSP